VLIPSLKKELSCSVFFCIFYCSISFPIFLGIVSHLFSLNIGWGTTVKSLRNDKWQNVFFKILRRKKTN